MPLFFGDTYSNVDGAKLWWIDAFDCKVAKMPSDWDYLLPSDVVLQIPRAQCAYDPFETLEPKWYNLDSTCRRRSLPSFFCDKLKKAHKHLTSRGILTGPIQDGGDMQFFEIRDVEGNLIQICKEP